MMSQANNTDDEVLSRKVLLYSGGMTLKVIKQEDHPQFLQELQGVTKIKCQDGGAEAYDGEWRVLEDEDLVSFITAKEERLEVAHLPEDTKQDYTLAALIVVT